jgi:excisionase family DNA binding protein
MSVTAGRPLTASEILTPQQLADRWQVTKPQVYRLAREGKVPCIRIGKYVRFPLPGIEQFESTGGTV